MEFENIKFGDKMYGKFSGINFVVVSTAEDFMGRGRTVFMVNEANPDETIAYVFDTFADYYERFVEVKTVCQRLFGGHDTNGNPVAVWMEYDGLTGEIMSVTKGSSGMPKRLYGVPQLPQMDVSKKEIAYWKKTAKNSSNILFYEY